MDSRAEKNWKPAGEEAHKASHLFSVVNRCIKQQAFLWERRQTKHSQNTQRSSNRDRMEHSICLPGWMQQPEMRNHRKETLLRKTSLSLYIYILTSATCANLVYIYCFPLFSIQMHTCKGTTTIQATQVIGGAGGLFLSQVVLAGFNLGPPLTSESSYIGSHNVFPLSEISLMIKQCISLRCCYYWPICKQ